MDSFSATRWLRLRLLRRPFELASSLSADSALSVLSNNVAPISRFSFGWGTGATPYKGNISSFGVRLTNNSGTRNSWRFVFNGRVNPTKTGCLLAGSIGPAAFVFVFSAIWLSMATLFFVVGTIGFFTDLATGHGLALLPLMLVPAAMLVFFLGLTEWAGRIASDEWASMEQWLQELLNP
jgi:hypothetical protein